MCDPQQMFTCGTCGCQYTSALVAAECCDPVWLAAED